jgi:hypothetical protein
MRGEHRGYTPVDKNVDEDAIRMAALKKHAEKFVATGTDPKIDLDKRKDQERLAAAEGSYNQAMEKGIAASNAKLEHEAGVSDRGKERTKATLAQAAEARFNDAESRDANEWEDAEWKARIAAAKADLASVKGMSKKLHAKKAVGADDLAKDAARLKEAEAVYNKAMQEGIARSNRLLTREAEATHRGKERTKATLAQAAEARFNDAESRDANEWEDAEWKARIAAAKAETQEKK